MNLILVFFSPFFVLFLSKKENFIAKIRKNSDLQAFGENNFLRLFHFGNKPLDK